MPTDADSRACLMEIQVVVMLPFFRKEIDLVTLLELVPI